LQKQQLHTWSDKSMVSSFSLSFFPLRFKVKHLSNTFMAHSYRGKNHHTNYGWGIQTYTHHRYYNEDVSMYMYQFNKIRKSDGKIGGIAPLPSFYCSKFKYQNFNEFQASKCDEITVEGAGYAASNGVYKRSTAQLPVGGDKRFGYFCKGIHGEDCHSGVINQWGNTVFGWGIINYQHHRYYNKHVSNTISSPFTKVRLDDPRISGLPPIPSMHCSKHKANYDKVLPFNIAQNPTPCNKNIPSKHWGHCIVYLNKDEAMKRDSIQYGFSIMDKPVNRTIGAHEDFDSHNVRKMHTQSRVTHGPGFKIMKMPDELIELLKPFFDSTYNSEFTVLHKPIPGEFTNIRSVPMDKIEINDFPQVKAEIIEYMQPILEEWTQQRLKHTSTFGVRIYKRDSMLINHIDKWDTHIASAVLQIAQDVDEGWPLEILDRYGNVALIYLQPWEMVLYEGSYFKHGRPMRFKGNMFANIFTHFAPFEY
jgi:hypothetical protein